MSEVTRLGPGRYEVRLTPAEEEVLTLFTAEHADTLEAMLARMVARWAAENLERVARRQAELVADDALRGRPAPERVAALARLRKCRLSADRGRIETG